MNEEKKLLVIETESQLELIQKWSKDLKIDLDIYLINKIINEEKITSNEELYASIYNRYESTIKFTQAIYIASIKKNLKIITMIIIISFCLSIITAVILSSSI